MKIGLYGGTFNPPHKGHGKVMEAVISNLGLDELWMIPCANPPHKTLPEGSPSPTERFEMLSSMADFVQALGIRQGKTGCSIRCLDVELQREGPSYTVDTLEQLRQAHPQDEFWLILGEDMIMSFFTWRSPQQVAKWTNLCGFLRSDQAPSPALQAQADKIAQDLGTKVKLITLEGGIPTSSTEIRQALSQGVEEVPLYPCTQGQIIRHGLYQVEKDLRSLDVESLRQYVFGFLQAKRSFHTIGVELECVKLAKHWGADVELARRAGILHDITKYWTHQEHLSFCDQHQYPLEPFEREQEKLLHAKSGAAYCKEVLGEAQDLCDAIACHTTGKANMTLLDKIVYVADYIEINRDFPEVFAMRKLAYEDLDKTLAYGLTLAVEEMQERNKVTHHNTTEAYEQYVSQVGAQA